MTAIDFNARISCLRHQFEVLNGNRTNKNVKYHALAQHEERRLVLIAEEIARLHLFKNHHAVKLQSK